MSVVAFDTLKFARSLRDKAKLPPEQAEGFADAIAEAMQGDLATKVDLGSAKAELRDDVQGVRSDLQKTALSLKADLREAELRLEAKMEAIKADLIKWTLDTVGFQTLAILGAVFALTRTLRP